MLYLKWITNKDLYLLYSPRNFSAQCCVAAQMGGGFGVGIDTCVCMTESLRCSPEMIIVLLIGHTPKQNESFKTKKIHGPGVRLWGFHTTLLSHKYRKVVPVSVCFRVKASERRCHVRWPLGRWGGWAPIKRREEAARCFLVVLLALGRFRANPACPNFWQNVAA